MLQPKRVKYRKAHRGNRRGKANRGASVAFGEFGLKAMQSCWITARQLEAARRAITHHVKRGGQIWIRVYPDKPVSRKPAETRQGGGKGNVDYWVAVVRAGRVIFEVAGLREDIAREAMQLAARKLPVPVKFVSRADTAAF
ncbi:MAG: 50S ribosomal protein L16 [Chloroflexi bacterium]|nr:50S ribosomal protein L16 [Chloroflexota bacterium]